MHGINAYGIMGSEKWNNKIKYLISQLHENIKANNILFIVETMDRNEAEWILGLSSRNIIFLPSFLCIKLRVIYNRNYKLYKF